MATWPPFGMLVTFCRTVTFDSIEKAGGGAGGRQAGVRDMKVTRRVDDSEPRQSWSGPAPVDNDP